MRYAIAADPAVIDSNFDGFADVVYIGDAGGQVWKWDLSAIGVASSGTVPTSVWPAGRLFEAPVVTVAGGRSHYHSIFQGAAAAMVDGAITLSVASGERTALTYVGQPNPADPNSLIGLYDDNNRFWVMKDAKPIGVGSIPAIPIREEGAALSGEPRLTDVTNETSDPDRTDAGYFFRVADGEKFITNHIVFSGVVVTLSYVPEDPSAPVDPDAGCTVAGTTNQWAWELDSAAGSFDSPDVGGATVRNLVLGNGAPTDPRLTLSKDLDGNLIVKITAQTSTGQMANPDAGNLNLDPVDMIYWRQNF
jgi:Tfp pilus tip-associated adhesin PilY1